MDKTVKDLVGQYLWPEGKKYKEFNLKLTPFQKLSESEYVNSSINELKQSEMYNKLTSEDKSLIKNYIQIAACDTLKGFMCLDGPIDKKRQTEDQKREHEDENRNSIANRVISSGNSLLDQNQQALQKLMGNITLAHGTIIAAKAKLGDFCDVNNSEIMKEFFKGIEGMLNNLNNEQKPTTLKLS